MTNEYDTLLKGDQATTNEYDDLLADSIETQTRALKSSMLGATKKNPDNEAKLQNLEEKTGFPFDTIGRNLPAIESKDRFESNDYNALLKDSPVVAKALSDPTFSDVAHDDILNLQGMEWLFSAVPQAFEQGQEQVELGKIGLSQVFGKATEEDLRRADELEARQGIWLGDDGWFSSSVVEATKLLPQLFATATASLGFGAAGAVTGATGALIFGQLGPQVATPEELITVPGAALTGFGFGARTGAVAVAFQQEAGLAYREFLAIKDQNGKPLDEDVARIAALASGAINAGLEVFALENLAKAAGGDKIINALKRKGLRKVLTRPSVQSAFKELAKRYVSGLSAEVSTEVAQEAVTILAGEVAKQFSEGDFESIKGEDFLKREAEVIEKTAQAMSLLAVPGPSINFTHDLSRIKKADQNQKTIQALGESAKSSKLRERLPEKYKEFVSKVRENGEVENIHIPADKFVEYFQSQNIDPSEIAREIPSISEQMTEAIATGGDIIIPLEDYATHIAPTEHHAGLSGDIRFHSGEMTLNEAQEFRKTATEQAEKTSEKVTQQVEADKTADDQADVIQEQVKEQLVKAGRTSDIAEQESLVVRSFFKTMARRTGQDPEALFKAAGLSIQGEQVVEGADEGLASDIEGSERVFQQDEVGIQSENFSKAGDIVDGRTVRGDVPNLSSIAATFNDSTEISGIREVPFSSFTLDEAPISTDKRVLKLAEEIKESGEINPLIVGIDELGPFIVEGATRFDALKVLGARSFPALVVVDNEAFIQGKEFQQDDDNGIITTEVNEGRSEQKSRQKAERNARTALRELSRLEVRDTGGGTLRPASGPGGVRNIAIGIRRDLVRTGRIDLRGLPASTPEELAVAAQLFRDPRFETFRIFYIKDGSIVGHEGLTSRMPSSVTAFFFKNRKKIEGLRADQESGKISLNEMHRLSNLAIKEDMARIQATMTRLESDGYYLLHNHPSGDPSPSIQDINMTDLWARGLQGFKGHVVINSGKFSRIEARDGKIQSITEKLPGAPKDDLLLSPEITSDLLQQAIGSPVDLANIAKEMQSGNEFVSVIYVSRGKIRAIQEVPVSLYISKKGFSDHIRGAKRSFGIQDAFSIYNGDKDISLVSKRLIRQGVIRDAFNVGLGSVVQETGALDVSVPTSAPLFKVQEPSKEFQQADPTKGKRGSISFSSSREKALITLLENADLSTFFHESGHFFLDTFQQVAAQTDNQQIKDDWIAIMNWLGVESADQIGNDQHEQWARGFESYIFEGKAPSSAMAEAFARFREWMVRVYRSIKNLKVELSDEVRQVMDRMLATDEEIETAQFVGEFQSLWASAQEAGITEPEFRNYRESAKKAADQAHKDLLNRATKVITRERTKAFKAARKETRLRVEKDVNLRPVYRTLAFFKAAPKSQTVKIDLTDDLELTLNFLRDAVSQGEAGSRISIETLGTGGTGETIGIPSTFPKFFKDKGFKKKEVLTIIDKTLAGKGITARQTRIVSDLVEGANEEFQERTDIEARDKKRIPAGSLDLETGDSFKINGELFRVKGVNDVGDLIIQDGERFEVDPFDLIPEPDEGSIKRGDDVEAKAQTEEDENQAGLFPNIQLPQGITPAKLSRVAIVDMFGKDFPGDMPSGTIQRGPGGLHPDVVADLFGFTSGDEMIQAIKEADPRKEVIERETDERMKSEFGDILEDGTIQEQAVTAVMNDKRGDVLATELRILEKLSSRDIKIGKRKDKTATRVAKSVSKETEKAARTSEREAVSGARNVNKTADSRLARSVAKRAIAEKRVRDIRPHQYQASAIQASKKVVQAMGKRDFEGAAEFKRQQLISHFMYIEARNAKEDIEKTRKFFRKFDSPGVRKNIPQDYLDQIDGILDRFEFRQISLVQVDRKKALAKWVSEQEAQGNEVVIDEKILNDAFRQSFKDMTVDELGGLSDTITNIEHLGRLKGKLIAGKEVREFNDVIDSLVDSIENNNDQIKESQNYSADLKEKIKRGMTKFHAEHTKMEFLFDKLDGFSPLGPVFTELFKPIADAESAEQATMERITLELKKILSKESKNDRSKWLTNRIFVPEVGKSFTKAEMISMALNWGNEGNREALLKGLKWDVTQAQAVLDHLTKSEWETVQSLWDLVDSIWPEIAELQKDLTGVIPEKVPASPVQTNHGIFSGGYYPLKYDGEHSYMAYTRDEKASTQDLLETSWIKPVTKHGHTIERVGSAGQRVKLDLSVLTEHLTNVVHDISHRKAVLDIDKILQDPRFREAVEQTAGKDMFRQIRPWLQAIANDRKDPASMWEHFIGRARVGATVVNMGWKITTAIVQPLGFLQTIDVLGIKYSMIGLTKYFGDLARSPWDLLKSRNDFAMERSVMMQNRQKTFDRDVRDALKNDLSVNPGFNQIRQSFFYLTGMMDMAVAVPSWLGAYQKGMDELFNGDEEKSIDFADSVVRKSQSAGGVKDLAAIQRGSELRRMFTMFYSYFSALYNLFSERIGQARAGNINLPQFAASMFFLWFGPAILSELIAGRGPDDDEEYALWASKNLLSYPFQTIVGVRDIAQGVIGDFGYGFTPVVNVFDATVQTTKSIAEGEVDKQFLKNIALTTGYWAQLPTRQMWITGEALYNFATGEEIEARDLFFPRRKK